MPLSGANTPARFVSTGMHFRFRKRRTTPAVIIVALIDVLIVLVIFLLVTTTFKQQNALKLQLPESSQGKKSGATENLPFIVSIDTNGVYFVDKMAVTFDQLEDRLKSATAKNPDVVLEINADDRSPLGKTVKVRDAAADAHIKNLVLLTKQPPKP
jgi:biopolymer transport protein ExbD